MQPRVVRDREVQDAGGDVVGRRRPGIGADHRRFGAGQVGADERIGAGGSRRLASTGQRADRDHASLTNTSIAGGPGTDPMSSWFCSAGTRPSGVGIGSSAVEFTPSVSGTTT